MKGERRRIGKCLLVAVLLTLLAFVSGGCAADTYTVCPGGGCGYTKIQHAIEAAHHQDTIEVYSGTYDENVHVDKPLILKGINTGGGQPVVDAGGNGSAIMIIHEGVVLDGFTATNASGFQQAGIVVHSGNNIVINNTVSNNDYGIYLFYASNNTLTGTIASNNTDGIRLYSSSNNNTLTGTIASNNTNGILLYSSSNNNTLTGNTAHSNYDGILMVSSSNYNNLTDNDLSSNAGRGIYLQESSNNTLTGNIANSNNFGIHLYSSHNNSLSANTANSNNKQGIYLETSSNNNNISGNIANSNNDLGIHLSYSSINTLTCNTADSNAWDGISLSSSSNNNTLTDNTISNNSNRGIYLSYSSNNNLIYNNYFNNTNNAYDTGNNIWNITQTEGVNIIGGPNLGGNFWSDYNGTDADGDGLGDTSLPYNSKGAIQNGGDCRPLVKAERYIFDTGEGSYPSISGTFTGTITPSRNLTLNTLYTYSCTGTGGHTKSINLYENEIFRATGVWSGYQGDWHNITFTKVALLKDHEYRYVIITGSYPQVVHADSKDVTGGTIAYTDFVDVDGKRHENWIPAIKLYFVNTSVTDLTLEEARAIAQNSTCVQEGTLTDTCFYNEYTRTWWFDLEPFTEVPNCNAACVVSEDTRRAEINWLCTMAYSLSR